MKRIISRILCFFLLVGLIPLPCRGQTMEVSAKSAVLMEPVTGTILYEKDAHSPLPPASVTKIMTLLLIMEAVDSGRITWTDTVTASESAASKGGSQVFLKAGETMTVRDMVKSIAVSSANDCACAMAEHLAGSEEAFVGKMNEKAKALGMNDTHFVNCTGLDDAPEAKEHLTSAHDIALMSRQLLIRHPEIKKFTTIWMDTIRGGSFGLSNTNKLIRFYPGATGLKTGYTSGAGYCLSATAQRGDMELIAAVMGCPTSPQRQADCKMLLDYGFAGYTVIKPELSAAVRLPVNLGRESSVNLVLGEQKALVLDKGQKHLVSQELELEDKITAPVQKGQHLGTLRLKAGAQILAELPLVAEKSVAKYSWWEIFCRLLQKGSL